LNHIQLNDYSLQLHEDYTGLTPKKSVLWKLVYY